MPEPFDPYYKWLGIPPEEQPPTHYRLLGLRRYEADVDVIEHAADRLMSHLRTLQAGQRASLSQQLLNEVAAARNTLLDPSRKQSYDASLQQEEVRVRPPISPRLKRKAATWMVGAVAAIFALVCLAAAVVVVIILGGGPSNDEIVDAGSVARADVGSPAQPVSPSRPTVAESDDEKAAVVEMTNKPEAPADNDQGRLNTTDAARQPTSEPSLIFDFSDEAHLKQHWEWSYDWTFAEDGGRAQRGARSFLRSRQQFAGDLAIDMEFRFGQAKFSNTGGCWVTLWGERLLITNGWRSLNAKIQIHREDNAIVYTYNGAERRIEVAPEVMAEPTTIEIRWRSRTSHFKRIEIKPQHTIPLPG